MSCLIVVGTHWGDEGRGKIIDVLSEKFDFIVRAQGGSNAGCVISREKNFMFNLIPAAIIYPHTKCFLGAGTVIDIKFLIEEIDRLKKENISLKDRLFISPYAHMVLPYHYLIDKIEEDKRKTAIGTTKMGIGPCYADKAKRIGIRIGSLLSHFSFKENLQKNLIKKNEEFERVYGVPGLSSEDICKNYLSLVEKIIDYIADVETMLLEGIKNKKTSILIEGAQGSLLDVNFGTYPFTTSSGTLSGALCAGAGIGPTKVDHCLGVIKPFCSRFGKGPFPTALTNAEQKLFCSNPELQEKPFGVERHLGWFDTVLAKHSISINGIDSLAITKLDLLDHLDKIKICIGYKSNDKIFVGDPLYHVEPIFETVCLKGWKESISNVKSYKDLPKNCKKFLARIEELCEVPISLISVGPKKEQTIFVNPNFYDKK